MAAKAKPAAVGALTAAALSAAKSASAATQILRTSLVQRGVAAMAVRAETRLRAKASSSSGPMQFAAIASDIDKTEPELFSLRDPCAVKRGKKAPPSRSAVRHSMRGTKLRLRSSALNPLK